MASQRSRKPKKAPPAARVGAPGSDSSLRTGLTPRGELKAFTDVAKLPAAPLQGFATEVFLERSVAHWTFHFSHPRWGVLASCAVSKTDLKGAVWKASAIFFHDVSSWLAKQEVAVEVVRETPSDLKSSRAPVQSNYWRISRVGFDAQLDAHFITTHSIAYAQAHGGDVAVQGLFSIQLPTQVLLGVLQEIASLITEPIVSLGEHDE